MKYSKSNRKGKTLVLGTDARVVLAIARSLGRNGVEVHLGWCPSDSIARRSRYVSRSHSIAPYSPTDLTWRRQLTDLLRNESFDLVIPCNDSTLVPLQLHKEHFAEFPSLHLHDDGVFNIVFDKLNTHELAIRNQVNVPRGVLVKSKQDHTDALDLRFPVVVKPRATFTAQSTAHSNVVLWAADRDELKQSLRTPPYHDQCLVQEVFRGAGVGIELLADGGKILTAFQHQRLHETMAYGSSYRMSVALDPELFRAASKLMDHLKYSGVAMVEFMRNAQTGKWVFVEINGRFWGSLPLAVAAGADFPYYLYQFRVEGCRQFPQTYRQGIRCRNLLLDWQGRRHRWQRNNVQGFKRILSLLHDSWNVLSLSDRLDSMTRDDLLPGLVEIGQTMREQFSNVLRKFLTIGRASTFNTSNEMMIKSHRS